VRLVDEDADRKGSEVFAAQTGMIMDTLAHTARSTDKVMGDTLRSGVAAKIGGAVIRASGLRKWTEGAQGGFWLGASPRSRMSAARRSAISIRRSAGLERVGISEAEWKIFQQARAL
jgi:hypothetical protein